MMRRLLLTLALIGSVIGMATPASAADTAGAQVSAYPAINNTWRSLSLPNGSINCVLQAKQPFSYLVQVKKVSGACRNLSVETYIYNSQFMADHDFNSYPPNGLILEGRAAGGQAICYVYVSWRDGANVFRDALYMRGGGVA